jgi:GntR family transcriptional repressor for pyruvate dehydrogenase complex
MSSLSRQIRASVVPQGHMLGPMAGDPAPGVRRDDRGLSAFQPIRLRKASDEVVAVLVDAIRAGIYRPGDLLPPERDLAARLDVSRVVLRDAIEALRREGILATRRGKTGGTVVESVDNLARVLAGLRGESTSNMLSLLEFRRALELASALLACRRATAEDMARLRRLVEDLEAALDRSHGEILQLDMQFHVMVAEVGRNRLLARALSDTLGEIIVLRSFFPHGFVEVRQSHLNQVELLRALESRELATIRAAVDHHLGALEEIVLGFRLRFADEGTSMDRDAYRSPAV